MKYLAVLAFLTSAAAWADTGYLVTHRTFVAPGASTSIAQYLVQSAKIRATGADGRTTYLFEGGKAYIVDNTEHTLQVVTGARVEQAADILDQRARLLADSGASMPAEKRAVFDKMAADMRAINERERIAPQRAYRHTARTEVVDGNSCEVWEGIEWQVKRFELCIAPLARVAGGIEVRNAMHELSRYWQGSMFALGMKLGNVGWWSGIEALHGLPLLIREFKDETVVSETRLTGFRSVPRDDMPFAVPTDYATREISLMP